MGVRGFKASPGSDVVQAACRVRNKYISLWKLVDGKEVGGPSTVICEHVMMFTVRTSHSHLILYPHLVDIFRWPRTIVCPLTPLGTPAS